MLKTLREEEATGYWEWEVTTTTFNRGDNIFSWSLFASYRLGQAPHHILFFIFSCLGAQSKFSVNTVLPE